MKLEDAQKLHHARPAADRRVELLRGHLDQFRNDFEGHLMRLHRVAAIEKALGRLPEHLASAQEESETALDELHAAIEHTRDELAQLDPDAA